MSEEDGRGWLSCSWTRTTLCLSLRMPGILALALSQDKGSELMTYDIMFKVQAPLASVRTRLFIDCLYPVQPVGQPGLAARPRQT